MRRVLSSLQHDFIARCDRSCRLLVHRKDAGENHDARRIPFPIGCSRYRGHLAVSLPGMLSAKPNRLSRQRPRCQVELSLAGSLMPGDGPRCAAFRHPGAYKSPPRSLCRPGDETTTDRVGRRRQICTTERHDPPTGRYFGFVWWCVPSKEITAGWSSMIVSMCTGRAQSFCRFVSVSCA